MRSTRVAPDGGDAAQVKHLRCYQFQPLRIVSESCFDIAESESKRLDIAQAIVILSACCGNAR